MKIKVLSIYAISVGLLMTACESMVELDPKNNVVAGAVFGNLSGAQAVLNSAYNRMIRSNASYGRDYVLMGDALADNLFTATQYSSQRWNTVNVNNIGQHYNSWEVCYQIINDLNEVIAKAPQIPIVESERKNLNSLLAQAYTLRALTYFDIARAYGYEPNKIPTTGQGAGFDRSAVIRLTPTTDVESAQPIRRSSIVETYTQVENDLTTAIGLFADATEPTNYYMTLGTAYALRGRLNLYWERWEAAISDFDDAFANSDAELTDDIVSAFTSIRNPESFTQLSVDYATQALGSGDSPYGYTHRPGYNGIQTFGGQTLANEVFALLEEGDDRLGLIFFDGGFNWSNKYNGAAGLYADHLTIIRYSDVLLMKAEALAQLERYGEAAALVTTLRSNRNASLSGIPTGPAIMNYIKDERRRELHFEGQRWFDLKRWGEGITKPAQATGASFIPSDDIRILARIPVTQITLFPELPQNPGY
ncbi:RagB/SusD family nutrient uptake outer membrane protein [Parapedobacter koreensis]|uniref:SusD family protein n=1 Tax=Parapedobacter koreensis TaxID=332977 RepID=A0A1H7R348_9SPHI|nr:RagB/SusD family nutrient uptake outer membrane protein [Parapedobacter koreensis]SEL54355.1 SusD family protein [Parapedobacter koreensis]